MLKLLFILSLIAIVVLSCTDDNPISILSLPVGGLSAGKALSTDSEACYLIQWDCDPSLWIAPEDSIFTIFYGDSLRFQTQGTSVHIEQYVSSSRKLAYYASEREFIDGRYQAAFRFTENRCGLWSSAITDNSLPVYIYKGNVKLVYRWSLNAQYQVVEADENYKIAFIGSDGKVVSVDFHGLNDRDNSPPSIGDDRYFLPVNQDAEGNLTFSYSESFCAKRERIIPVEVEDSPDSVLGKDDPTQMKESVLVEEVDEALTVQFEFVEDLQEEEIETESVVETETESISTCNVNDTSGKIYEFLSSEPCNENLTYVNSFDCVVEVGTYILSNGIVQYECQGSGLKDSIGDKDGNKDVGCKPSWGRYYNQELGECVECDIGTRCIGCYGLDPDKPIWWGFGPAHPRYCKAE